MKMKDINEVFNITPDKLMGDKALSRAVGRINRRWLFMSMEDLEFIAKTTIFVLGYAVTVLSLARFS